MRKTVAQPGRPHHDRTKDGNGTDSDLLLYTAPAGGFGEDVQTKHYTAAWRNQHLLVRSMVADTPMEEVSITGERPDWLKKKTHEWFQISPCTRRTRTGVRRCYLS